ncbi:MAG: hypothetical protein WCC94_09945, partial [Candidatus Bathyarchaeia archaeon]
MRKKWAFSILLVLFSIFTVASLISIPIPQAEPAGPTLTLTPNYGATGDHVDAIGSGFTGSSGCVLTSYPGMSVTLDGCTIISG